MDTDQSRQWRHITDVKHQFFFVQRVVNKNDREFNLTCSLCLPKPKFTVIDVRIDF